MELLNVWRKFQVWGVPGVRNSLLRAIAWRRASRDLACAAKQDAGTVSSRGLTLIGEFMQGASNSKTNRDFAYALRDAGIPFQTYSVDWACTVPREDFEPILTPRTAFRLHRYTHVVEMFRSPLPRGLVPRLARIAFWEGTRGMFEVWPFLRGTDALVAMSDFNRATFLANPDGAPVHKILYPLRPLDFDLPSDADVRDRFGIGREDFVVFFNFDFGSYCRKNPGAAIRAFAAALRDVPKTRLVFKVQGASRHPREVAEVWRHAAEAGVSNQLTMIADYLPHRLLYGLTATCDVYLSLHRGEGFGLGMAEAMMLGKPVVATDWSASTEFVRSGVAFPVPFRLVAVRPGEYFTSMGEWAEADVDAAASILRRLFDNVDERVEVGRRARAFVADHFSTKNFKASVEAFLDDM